MKYLDSEKLIAEIERYENTAIEAYNPLGEDADFWHGRVVTCEDLKTFITSLQQEQQEVDLEKFTQKMNDWKKRYNYPDNIPIKATMAFTARMFYMYPDVARQWYDNLPKATMD